MRDINKLNCNDFLEYYFLKEELVVFCKTNGLSASDKKDELTQRIYEYLKSGIKNNKIKRTVKRKVIGISEDTVIGPNISCSEVHRKFFEDRIGKSFKFKLTFQDWLRDNPNKTYGDAVEAYYDVINDKKQTTIGKQFQYNQYIRDFFVDNKRRKLADAIKCWKYKKSLKGHNKYEKSDLIALNDDIIKVGD